VDHRPASLKRMAACVPIYREMSGWQEDISAARDATELPEAARAYIEIIEEITGVPVSIVSVGPGREETIVVKYPGI